MELHELKEHVRVIYSNPDEVSVETVQAVIGDLIGAIAGANDIAEIALSRMSEHEQHQPIGKALKRLHEYAHTLVDDTDGFTKSLPNEQGYWWRLVSEGCAPVPVWIMKSGTDGTHFAAAGQHGWDRWQDLNTLGGYWKKADAPAAVILRG